MYSCTGHFHMNTKVFRYISTFDFISDTYWVTWKSLSTIFSSCANSIKRLRWWRRIHTNRCRTTVVRRKRVSYLTYAHWPKLGITRVISSGWVTDSIPYFPFSPFTKKCIIGKSSIRAHFSLRTPAKDKKCSKFDCKQLVRRYVFWQEICTLCI